MAGVPYTQQMLKVVVAQICQTIGWHSINATPLELMTHILHKFLQEVPRIAHRYSELDSRTEVNLDDVALAFNEMNINLDEIEEYVQYVDPVICAVDVPKYPLPKSSNLNFLKPGSKEVVSRPIHIHEHLPPMLPPEEESNLSQELPDIEDSINIKIENTDTIEKSANPDIAIGAIKANGTASKLFNEEVRPTREIQSVIMTTSGFISPAREGKLPDAKQSAQLMQLIDSLTVSAVISNNVTPVKPNTPGSSGLPNKKWHPIQSMSGNNQSPDIKLEPPEQKKFDKESHPKMIDERRKLQKKLNKARKFLVRLKEMPAEPKDTIPPGWTIESILERYEQLSGNPNIKLSKNKMTKKEKSVMKSMTKSTIVAEDKLSNEPDRQKLNIFLKIKGNNKPDSDQMPSPSGNYQNKQTIKQDVINLDEYDDDFVATPATPGSSMESPVKKKKPTGRPRKDSSQTPTTTKKKKSLLQTHSQSPMEDNSWFKKQAQEITQFLKRQPPPDMMPLYMSQPGLIPTNNFYGGNMAPFMNTNFPQNPNFLPPMRPPIINNPLQSNINPIDIMAFPMRPPTFASTPLAPEPIAKPSLPQVQCNVAPLVPDTINLDELSSPPVPVKKEKRIKHQDGEKREKKVKKEKKDKLKKYLMGPMGDGVQAQPLSEAKLRKLKRQAEKEKAAKYKKWAKEQKKALKQQMKMAKMAKNNLDGGQETSRVDDIVPKLTLRVPHSPAIEIPDEVKEEEQQKTPKRDQSPELARISPLITRPPKMKPPPTTEGTAQIHSSVTPPSTSSSKQVTGHKVGTGQRGRPRIHPKPAAPTAKPNDTPNDNDGNQVWICPACGKVDDGTPMIGCDRCDAWYHWVCVGILEAPDQNEDWFCRVCITKKQEGDTSNGERKKKRKKKYKKEH